MAKPDIGNIECPCCGESAAIREQKNGRSYVMCKSVDCGFQGFTRSAGADTKLRAKMRNTSPPPAAAPINDPPPKKKGFFDDLADL